MNPLYRLSQITTAIAFVTALASSTSDAALPSVPGTVTTVYTCSGDGFDQMCLAPDGTMYVGHDLPTAPHTLRIWRIGSGGCPVELFGDQPILDADGVAVDVPGSLLGDVPGTVLVGGGVSGISAIDPLPPNSVSTVYSGVWFGPYMNIDSLKFDRNGRLLIADTGNGIVWVATNRTEWPLVLIGSPQAWDVAEDSAGNFWVTGYDYISKFSTNGGLITNNCVPSVRPYWPPIAFSADSFWGTNIYTIGTNGVLLRVDAQGNATPAGTGFESTYRLLFGPDESLYVVPLTNSQILKISRAIEASIRCSQVEICWNSSSNHLYKVQYRSALTTNLWTDLFPTNIVATGSQTCTHDDILPGMTQRYYQVVAAP